MAGKIIIVSSFNMLHCIYVWNHLQYSMICRKDPFIFIRVVWSFKKEATSLFWYITKWLICCMYLYHTDSDIPSRFKCFCPIRTCTWCFFSCHLWVCCVSKIEIVVYCLNNTPMTLKKKTKDNIKGWRSLQTLKWIVVIIIIIYSRYLYWSKELGKSSLKRSHTRNLHSYQYLCEGVRERPSPYKLDVLWKRKWITRNRLDESHTDNI